MVLPNLILGFLKKYFAVMVLLFYLSGMSKGKISQKTGKKVLEVKTVKLNPDAILVIKKQVKSKLFQSENSAINIAVEEKFLPELQKDKK